LAGIYIHIPFCRQACHYCDFHFSTNLTRLPEMIEAIYQELEMQKNYLKGDLVDSIYFGGGTPSLVSQADISKLLNQVYKLFPVTEKAEITLEANPDDLSIQKLTDLKASGINRLSIGIQSFSDVYLKLMNRLHTAEESWQSFQNARQAGFENISIDLIYAVPAETHELWRKDLAHALALKPEHISAYCLTIEENTAFGNWVKKGKMQEADEDYAAQEFEILVARLVGGGYQQYEISNFCLPGYYSRHNSNYWKKGKYLGVGPSAHSYDGGSRQYNVSNNTKYLNALAENRLHLMYEMLEPHDQVNEYIMTSLRTQWGCDLQKLLLTYEFDLLAANEKYITTLIEQKKAVISENHLMLTDSGKLLADKIASDLFLLKQ
jgi:oxygen-independent coproporphyrinogen III oxidase